MATEDTVSYKLSDGVAWLGLNRPHKRNAIDGTLLTEFEAALRRAHEEARALVIFGHGSCFSAGLRLPPHPPPGPAAGFPSPPLWPPAVLLPSPGPISAT